MKRRRGRPPRPARQRRRPEAAGEQRTSVYQEIKNAILAGVLRPMERITETGIARRFVLTRTPVREAFRVLAAEGLLVVVPQRGSFVSALSLEDLLEIYQIRTPLEAMAARIAAETLGDAELDRLETLVRAEQTREKALPAQERLRLSARFHEMIIASTRNQRLIAVLKELQSLIHRARTFSPSTPRRLQETWKEHAALLTALRARDADAAERLMRGHLEAARASTLESLLPGSQGPGRGARS
ncbi:MAG: GntR family transcriptional regulator [Candidatus Rokuibacteriota bacterium]